MATLGVVTTSRSPFAYVLMAASGFAGLGCQIVWTQWSALWLGHEAAAVLAVVAAFFGGLAVGASMLGARIERSERPGRWYAACEAVVALWSVVLIASMPSMSGWLLGVIGAQPSPAWQWTVAFVGTFVLLLPATAAMGATLPAIERATSRLRDTGRSIAGLYAANTFGAVLGVLAAAFWLVPTIGLARTAGVCAALNLTCAVCAMRWLDRRGDAPVAAPRMATRRGTALSIRVGVTGLLGIGYEVLVVRVLGQVSEDTVYTFALSLAVYLVGTAVGAAAYQRWFARDDDDAQRRFAPRVADRLLVALAVTCLVGMGALWSAELVETSLRSLLGDGMTSALVAEAALAVTAFALPTVVMGAMFCHLSACANASGIAFGRALGVNIVGAAVAPGLFGVLLAPWLGPKGALLVIVAGYLVLTTRRARSRPLVWIPASFVAVIAIAAPPLAFVDLPEDARLVSYVDGVTAAVSVVEDADGVSRLRIDNRQQEGSSATRFVDGRQALLPLLLHPARDGAPLRALFLGLGTGVTASTAADVPGLDVDAVELLPEVVIASRHFTQAFDDGVPNPHLHLLVADARRYVRTTSRTYHVIVADNFHPARGGSGALYTVEHFAAVRERLTGDGLFCQWLPLHQLDLATLRSIVRSFMTVYPHGRAMLASNSLGTPTIGLVGNRDGARLDVGRGARSAGRIGDARWPGRVRHRRSARIARQLRRRTRGAGPFRGRCTGEHR